MLKINNLSSSGKKINNMTLTFLELGGKVPIFRNFSLRSQQLYIILKLFFPLVSFELNSKTNLYSFPTPDPLQPQLF